MFKAVENENEIKLCQDKFEEILKHKTTQVKRKLSHPRTKEDFDENKGKLYDTYWSSQFEFWSVFDHTKPKNKNRYWNAFGLKNPLNNERLTITIEICIPKKGVEPNIAGLFVIDNMTKDIAIVRRGRLSRKSMDFFWSNYKGKTIDLIDGTKVALISIFPKNETQYFNFQKNVRDFIVEISKIKSTNTETNDFHTGFVLTDSNQENKPKAILIKKNNITNLPDNSISNPLISTSDNTFLSVEAAKKYYINLLAYHKIDDKPITKIPYLKNVLENEILAEATGIQHYYDRNENGKKIAGQKSWLLDNKEKNRDRHGNPASGVIPSDIVSGIINTFEQRNIAEHDKDKITYATYLGIFDLMARVISCFSGTSIPVEILEICNLKKP